MYLVSLGEGGPYPKIVEPLRGSHHRAISGFASGEAEEEEQRPHDNVQSSVKTFLPGFGNGWLKYCVIVQLLGRAAEHFECDAQNLSGMFLHNSVQDGGRNHP